MKIKSLKVHMDGYAYCQSRFYAVNDYLLEDMRYTFLPGINKLVGEIDSGNWAVSYTLSMYQKHRPRQFFLFEPPEITVNDQPMSLEEVLKLSCYMDRRYPLFSGKKTVRKLVEQGLRRTKMDYSSEDIRKIFSIYEGRFERKLRAVGNEIFRCMAAIGFANGKEIFCFPWFSQELFWGYHLNLTGLLDILADLEKVAIVPVGHPETEDITKIMDMLDCNMPPSIHRKGLSSASNIENIAPFIRPQTPQHNENVWEYCASVVAERKDEELEPYLPTLLEWMGDLSWTGAEILLDKLKHYSGENLEKPFVDRFNDLKALNAAEGKRGLDALSQFLENEKLKAKLPQPIIEELQKHYDDVGVWYGI